MVVSSTEVSENFLAASQTQKSTSILIVEDEAGVRELLEQMFFLEGYTTTAVDNGSDGVTQFRERPHDLVFTDFRMPGMSGADVATAIKTLSARTPVVVVTGWDPETFAEELRGVGVDHVLKKPFRMDEVLGLVSELTRD